MTLLNLQVCQGRVKREIELLLHTLEMNVIIMKFIQGMVPKTTHMFSTVRCDF